MNFRSRNIRNIIGSNHYAAYKSVTNFTFVTAYWNTFKFVFLSLLLSTFPIASIIQPGLATEKNAVNYKAQKQNSSSYIDYARDSVTCEALTFSVQGNDKV
jgi:p-aminobenzoyl-glutamate transporter AbgT